LSRVHPEKWIEKNTQSLLLENLVRALPKAIPSFFKRIVKRISGSSR
jgi:hypothetical protein